MKTISLAGQWQVCRDGQPELLPATVPGCVHTDLLAADKIPDPFYRTNEKDLQWISETGWTYSRQFDVPAEMLSAGRLLLACAGLDTLATIKINGRLAGKTDNQFRTWEFDVKPILRRGQNEISVHFASTYPYIDAAMKRRAMAAGGHVPWEKRGRSYVRKSPCNYGWDWGPALATCGIWRDLQIVAFDQARLSDVHLRQQHDPKGKTVAVTVTVAAETVGRAALTAHVAITHAGRRVAVAKFALPAGCGTAEIVIAKPKLWWPNGMGEQPLYEVKVELLAADGEQLDTWIRRIGLRTLALDRHPDQWGESFQFVVNGKPFFAKGANWIPADIFTTRLARADYAHLLTSAAEVNMNMLRVWGGGIYEEDLFYELCDELGICVWQDFMFACAAYPAYDRQFLANVRAEAEDNVRRIRHHACLALWCGNNELEQCRFVHPFRNPRPDLMTIPEYRKLFDRLLPQVVAKLDPDTAYWPSSAHTPGPLRFKDPCNANSGDAHLWDVWHGKKPFEWYRTCEHRFNSEFGFQSFPEPRTVATYTLPADRNVTTKVMEHHQRSGIGNTTIMTYLLDWFRLPTRFDATLRLSQILQGMAMKYAVEHWRRSMPRGMGTIYWQLNDNWPVASWASIDYFGRWKALHYLARKFFAPVLLSGVENLELGKVDLWLTNDRLRPVRGKLAWTVTDLAGQAIAAGAANITAAAQTSAMVKSLDIKQLLAKHQPDEMLVWLEADIPGETVSANLVTLARPKHLELPDPRLSTRVQPRDDGSFAVTVTARHPALWAWLDLGDHHAQYSDNYVHVRPGAPAVVIVTPEDDLDVAAFRQALTINSLLDTYQ